MGRATSSSRIARLRRTSRALPVRPESGASSTWAGWVAPMRVCPPTCEAGKRWETSCGPAGSPPYPTVVEDASAAGGVPRSPTWRARCHCRGPALAARGPRVGGHAMVRCPLCGRSATTLVGRPLRVALRRQPADARGRSGRTGLRADRAHRRPDRLVLRQCTAAVARDDRPAPRRRGPAAGPTGSRSPARRGHAGLLAGRDHHAPAPPALAGRDGNARAGASTGWRSTRCISLSSRACSVGSRPRLAGMRRLRMQGPPGARSPPQRGYSAPIGRGLNCGL